MIGYYIHVMSYEILDESCMNDMSCTHMYVLWEGYVMKSTEV